MYTPVHILDGIYIHDTEGYRVVPRDVPLDALLTIENGLRIPISITNHASMNGELTENSIRQGAAFIREHVNAGHRIIVHSQNGVVHAAFPVLAYLLGDVGLNLSNAYTLICNQFYMFKLPKEPLSILKDMFGFADEVWMNGFELNLVGSINLGISPIVHNVHISGIDAMFHLKGTRRLGIQSVLRLDDDDRAFGNWSSEFTVLDMPTRDGYPLSCDFIRSGTAFIHQQTAQDKKVLVHCQAGVSRSVTLAMSYFIEYHGMSLAESYRTILVRRAVARPHPVLLTSLIECYGLPYALQDATDFEFLNTLLQPVAH